VRVVVVADGRKALALREVFEATGATVDMQPRVLEALDRLRRRNVDAALIDRPIDETLDLITRARGEGLRAPILVVTEHHDRDAWMRAYDAGADDCIHRCPADELLARVRALVRRASGPSWAPLSCGLIVLHRDEGTARVGDREVLLSPRERALLEMFLRRQGQILTRPEILLEVFGTENDPGTNVVDVHVAHLRQKLRGGGARIETLRGLGYRLSEGDTGPIERFTVT
jgi:DNA-binding response OmpR family regulator